jgi:hypothetical protein
MPKRSSDPRTHTVDMYTLQVPERPDLAKKEECNLKTVGHIQRSTIDDRIHSGNSSPLLEC